MFDVFYTGPRPNLFAFETRAQNLIDAANQSRTEFFWFINGNCDYVDFNFDWHPAPWDYEYIHVFPTQWQTHGGVYFAHKNAVKLNKLKFQTSQAVKSKLHADVFYSDSVLDINEAAAKSTTEFFWYLDSANDYTNFDLSWHCDVYENDFTHVFPSQWQANGGVYYAHKNKVNLTKLKFQTSQVVKSKINADIFYSDSTTNIHEAAEKSTTEFFWYLDKQNDYTNFDFSWHCNVYDNDFIHVFPSQWQANGGVYYAHKNKVNLTKLKFQTCQSVKRLKDITNWIVPDNLDVTNFDFSWHPNPLEEPYEYRFPTQHQRSGGPIYKGTAGIKYISAQKVKTNSTQIFYIDFLNEQSELQFCKLQEKYPEIKKTRYVDSYLNVLKRIVNIATTEFVWVASSICNYIDSNFDFSWHPEESQKYMIHCFGTNNQPRGDTFYIHVDSFKQQMYDLELLDWFNVIHYVEDMHVIRFDWPTHYYKGDNLVEEIKNYKFTTPYAVFTNQTDCYPYANTCLWSEKDRTIESFTNSNAICLVPRDAKTYIKTQIYDYPYISKNENKLYFAEQQLDIVYISNGEPNEQEYWDHLNFRTLANFHRGQIHWVKGVNGRDAAYKAAAETSTTPWFFAVFAKLRVDPNFDFKWQPDYFQEPKHYIFHAHNPINGLEYGHQAMIAYNKKLALTTKTTGLDFTLNAPHQVVPILSGIAEFNQDAWMTWRTAFREVIKLQHFSKTAPTVENEYRLKRWCNLAQGQYAGHCLDGARDAVEYYDSVNGDFDKLKLTYEWSWLKQYYDTKY